jgi:hypothetical protein
MDVAMVCRPYLVSRRVTCSLQPPDIGELPEVADAEGRPLPIESRLRRFNVPARSGAPAVFRGYFSIEE